MTLTEWRFWSKVDIREDNECWLWQGALLRNGYGYFQFRQRNEIASRVAWQLYHNQILTNSLILILHTCDSPPCCNPNHLFLGTHQVNSIDSLTKGRRHPNQLGGNRKLNSNQVKQIRNLLQKGYTHHELSIRFKIGTTAISNIRTGVSHAY